ncbi:leucine efflux protein LeuE [Crenobacter sp. SG2303]|uniref:Leucine efflux protein LeuE n=1 Tax=Crenobacter oryzisoli TaxID=3056844 RepID=A0ABT7XTC9_9NEIS|nr:MULTISPECIES: leucine efflux protein LeuE [unclassified Crenobacter]MDN0077055.1 leucine efflux protein LeuE [Crenobacter sp. SG2303]MDN0082186.1 leucine efflux protein LeuE [Crenobacter sp. SG2305]
MLGITDPLTFLIGTIFIVLLPGPNSLYVLSVAAQRGVKAGFVGAFGVFTGDAMLMLATAAGAASLLKALPGLFLVLKYAGAAYLAWVGVNMLKGAVKSWSAPAPVDTGSAALAVDMRNPFTRALSISLMNPKAILFFLSFFVQFVDPAYSHPALTFVALGLIVQACSATYLTVLILAGVRLAAAFRARRRLAGAATGGVGVLFLGFGAKLAAASLN